MDPTLPKANSVQKISIVVAPLILVIILVLFILNYFHLFPSSKPHSISKPVPVTLNLARGNLASINGTRITVNAYGKPKTFSLSGTKDFNKVVSGQIGKDAKTQPTTISELKIGQEVLVIADIGSIEAKTVYILR